MRYVLLAHQLIYQFADHHIDEIRSYLSMIVLRGFQHRNA